MGSAILEVLHLWIFLFCGCAAMSMYELSMIQLIDTN